MHNNTATVMPAASAVTTTLVDLLRERASHLPAQRAYTFLRDGDGAESHLTYGELDERARAIAAHLQAQGLSGERAVMLYPPGLDFIAAFFGCLYARVVAAPVYAPRRNASFERVQKVCEDARATTVLGTRAVLEHLGEQLRESGIDRLKPLATDDISFAQAAEWRDGDHSADDLAFLQYTSGSTATPRGVMLTHGNLMHNLQLIHRRFGAHAGSRGVIWLPPYHDMGLIGGVLVPLLGAFPVVLMSPVSALQRPIRWLQAIGKYRATISGGPNFAYELCLDKVTAEQCEGLDLSSWRVAFNGAEPIRADTLQRFSRHFASCGFRRQAFYPCYGLAEASLFVTGNAPELAPVTAMFDRAALTAGRVVEVDAARHGQRLVSSGRPSASEHVVIVDPDTRAACLPAHVGEIWIAGPSVAHGYWNRPDESAHTFDARLADGEGPYMRSGDLGFVKDGELFVTGRLKELIIVRGHNHYPQDIELTAAQSHPLLRAGRGAAFAVEREDEEVLVLVHEVDRRHDEETLPEAIGAVRAAVSVEHQLQLGAVVLVKAGTVPVTSSGKVQRNACRALWQSGDLPVLAAG